MIYIAGPFFNTVQRAGLEAVITALRMNKLNFYSPMAELEVKPNSDKAEREKAFDGNCQAIDEANAVLAIMDYSLPEGQNLLLTQGAAPLSVEGDPKIIQARVLAELALPDVGTVWEIGYAFAACTPIFAYWSEKPKKINLMLAETFDGFLFGLADLHKFSNVCLSSNYSREALIDVVTQEWQGQVH